MRSAGGGRGHQAYEFLGPPEGYLPLAEMVDLSGDRAEVEQHGPGAAGGAGAARDTPAAAVPMHLRNAPTVADEGAGLRPGYQYAHDHPGHFAVQDHLPEAWPAGSSTSRVSSGWSGRSRSGWSGFGLGGREAGPRRWRVGRWRPSGRRARRGRRSDRFRRQGRAQNDRVSHRTTADRRRAAGRAGGPGRRAAERSPDAQIYRTSRRTRPAGGYGRGRGRRDVDRSRWRARIPATLIGEGKVHELRSAW